MRSLQRWTLDGTASAGEAIGGPPPSLHFDGLPCATTTLRCSCAWPHRGTRCIRCVDRLSLSSSLRVLGVGDRVARTACRSQPVLHVVAQREDSVIGQVAVVVVGRRRCSHRRVLVQRVGRVAGAAAAGGVVQPVAGGCALADSLVGLVVAMRKSNAARGGRGGSDQRAPGDVGGRFNRS